MLCACWLNIVKAVEFAMTGGRDLLTGDLFGLETPTDFPTFGAFQKAFYEHLDDLVEFMIDNIDKQTTLSMKVNPSPVLSGTFRSCMERGRDIFDGGMEYSNTTFKSFGLATTVDSILAVKKVSIRRQTNFLSRTTKGPFKQLEGIRKNPVDHFER